MFWAFHSHHLCIMWLSYRLLYVQWARSIKKPVVTSLWLRQCVLEHRQVPHDPFRMPALAGLRICATGISLGKSWAKIVLNSCKYHQLSWGLWLSPTFLNCILRLTREIMLAGRREVTNPRSCSKEWSFLLCWSYKRLHSFDCSDILFHVSLCLHLTL